MYLLYNSSFAKCIVINFFLVTGSFSYIKACQADKYFNKWNDSIHNLKVFCARWKSKSETKLCVTDEKMFFLCSLYDHWDETLFVVLLLFCNSRQERSWLILIFGLLFKTNASDVRLLYRKRDLTQALCR